MGKPTELELAYVAGYMDADGSFMISRVNNSHRIEAVCASTVLEVLEPLQDHWGGDMWTKPNYGANSKDITHWRVVSRLAAQFIEDIYPYLGLKKERAAACVEWQVTRNPDLIQVVREANRRGRNG